MRIFSVCLFLFVLSGALTGQDVELVVTATKEPVPAETLPAAVVVLDSEDLAEKATVSEALDSTLSVRLSALTPGQPALTAPGFGENGSGRISLLLDGVPQNNPDMSSPPLDLVPLFALERIEVLQGPASALYGDGAVGGAVNLVTKVPEALEMELSNRLETTLTNRQSAALGLPIGVGGLLLSVQRDQVFPTRERSDSDQYQLWSKFTYPFVEGEITQEGTVWLAMSRATGQLPGSLTETEYERNPDQAKNTGDEVISTTTKGGAAWVWDAADWRITLPVSASYRAVRSTTASYSAYVDSGLLLVNGEPRFALALGSWAGAEVSWSGGLGISAVRLAVDRFTVNFSALTMAAAIDRWTGSLWNRMEAAWNGRWFLSASLRSEAGYTQASSKQSPKVDGRDVFWPVSGQVGVTWLPAAGTKIGVEAARVFRYPFIDEMINYYGTSGDIFYDDFEAENGYSLSSSLQWHPGWVNASLSGTLLWMDNEVVYDGALYRSVNDDDLVHLTGLVRTVFPALPATEVGTEYAFEMARYVAGPSEGKMVPLVPAHRGRAWIEFAWGTYGMAELSWSASTGFYRGGDAANSQPQISGRQTVDAGITAFLGGKDLRLRLYAKNLTNDRTPTHVYYAGYYPSDGRIAGAMLTWSR